MKFTLAILSLIILQLTTQIAGAFEDINRANKFKKIQDPIKYINVFKNSEKSFLKLYEDPTNDLKLSEDEEKFFDNQKDLDNDKEPTAIEKSLPIKDKELDEIQKAVVASLKNKGKWAFEIIYLSKKNETEKLLASYNNDMQLKPASTQKIFTAFYAFTNDTDSNELNIFDPKNKLSVFYNKIAAMLHVSNNQMADSILMSAANNNKLSTAVFALKKHYADLGDADLYTPADGSGLSYTNKVTVHLETSLLKEIYAHEKFDEFKHLMAHPGPQIQCEFDTLSYQKGFAEKHKYHSTLNTFHGVFSKGLHAKTGTLSKTKALAGFVETKNGIIIFSIIGDYLKISTGEAFAKINSLVHGYTDYVDDLEAEAEKIESSSKPEPAQNTPVQNNKPDPIPPEQPNDEEE